MFVIRSYQPADKDALIRLWSRCGLLHSLNNPIQDIERKQGCNPEWLLVGVMDDIIVASVMVGYDGHRGNINYLGVDPDFQRQGLGRKMMENAEIVLKAAGCPKVNLCVRNSNRQVLKFYESIGYLDNECISLGKRLEKDEPFEL